MLSGASITQMRWNAFGKVLYTIGLKQSLVTKADKRKFSEFDLATVDFSEMSDEFLLSAYTQACKQFYSQF